MLLSNLPPEMLDHIHHYLAAEDSLSLSYASNSIFLKTLAGKQMVRSVFNRCWLGNESYEEAKYVLLETQKNWADNSFSANLDTQILSSLKNHFNTARKRILMSLKADKYAVGRICLDLAKIHRSLELQDCLENLNRESDNNDVRQPRIVLKKPLHYQDVTYFLPGESTSLHSSTS
jgi:hypothetical protein